MGQRAATLDRTSFLDRIPVEEITADARQARPGRILLALFGAVFIAIGWTVAKVFRVLFLSAAWCMSGMKYGWRLANGTLNRPTWDQLYTENESLKAELGRLG